MMIFVVWKELFFFVRYCVKYCVVGCNTFLTEPFPLCWNCSYFFSLSKIEVWAIRSSLSSCNETVHFVTQSTDIKSKSYKCCFKDHVYKCSLHLIFVSRQRGPSGAQSSNPVMDIIGAEDEDFENDEQPVSDTLAQN